MSSKQGLLAAMVAATLVAGVAYAEEPPTPQTREEYKAQVEPICQRNAEDNKQILKGAQAKVRHNKMRAAGAQFLRASKAFGAAIDEIVAVPRPPADDARLVKWFGFLRIVQKNLRKVAIALKEENRVRANHEVIRAERSANAANNVSSVFRFLQCHLSPSRFR